MVKLATNKPQANNKAQSDNARSTETQFGENHFNELRFKLSTNLQSSLDLDATLKTFFRHVQSVIGCSGMLFSSRQSESEVVIGTKGRHRVSYNVSSGADKLGELCFLRSNKFAEAELAVLETLIGVLFYPLRNALKYKEALESSLKDALTGVGNRFSLEFNFSREIKLAKRHKKALAVLLIDVDHFKKINDSYGHKRGDVVLKKIAGLISDSLRETDQVFRYGGEEFVAVLNETDMENAMLTAERIRANIAEHEIVASDARIGATVSIGIASLSMDDSFDELFERADKAMYQAKKAGRNQIVCSGLDKKTEIKKIA